VVDVNNGSVSQIISNETIEYTETVADSIIYTNLGHLAGFVIEKVLDANYTITVNVVVEKYDTTLNQKLYKQLGVSETPQSTRLQSQTEEYFNLYENIYYKVNASHEYGTLVEVSVFVLKPLDVDKQYYTIANVELNGIELQIEYVGEGELDDNEGYYYSFSYNLVGADLPTVMNLDVSFNAMYHIGLC
jgi:hypothetical protein